MSYLNRLRPTAKYIAPSGAFIFFNIDSVERSGGKKGSTQEIVDSDESVSQDQGNRATTFTIPAYFTGQDYDLFIDQFYSALEEKYTLDNSGLLIHPRWGNINVFPFEWTQKEELINGAQVGRLDITFREVFPFNVFVSELGSLAAALAALDALIAFSRNFADQISLAITQATTSFAGRLEGTLGIISNTFDGISQISQSIQDGVTVIENAIDNSIENLTTSASEVVNQTQLLMRLPARIEESAKSKIEAFKQMANDLANIFLDRNETIPTINKNDSIGCELIGGFAVAVLAESITFNDFTKRSEVIDSIDLLNEAYENFNDIFNQTRTNGNIGDEFSGDHDFFSLLQDLISRINSYMLNFAFDLKAEKRFILKSNSDAITECYKAYGNVQSDTMLEFIETNKLKHDEFMQLNAGREIVVYV